MPITTVHVHEITLAAPNIIRVVVNDQEIVEGVTVDMGSVQGTFLQEVTAIRPDTGVSWPGKVVGRSLTWIFFYDSKPTAFLNRATVDNIANWPTIGGRTVTAVCRITKPFQECFYGLAKSHSVMRHELFLVLSGDLPSGSYTISCTGNPFPATAFTFNDYTTRCSSIHATQVGHRLSDKHKVGYLSLWVPEHGTEGAVAFSATQFEVIDSGGVARFTGTVALQKSATDTETSESVYYHPSTTVAAKVITAITKANPGVVTIAGHGYTTGQRKAFRGINGMTALEGITANITVIDVNSFSIGINTTAYGTFTTGVYAAGYNNLCYDTFLSNSGCTNIYKLDYSAFTPAATGGNYRLRIAGLGTSYPFKIDSAINRKMADVHFKGAYNQQYGMALSSSIGGWERPMLFKDLGGAGVFTVYETLMPASMDSQAGIGAAGELSGKQGAVAPWGPGARLVGHYMPWSDAGDMDFHLYRHAACVWTMLEFGYVNLPSPARNINWGFPKATVLDASFYAGTDSLPDIVHIAIRTLDIFRQTQKADGSVYSGFQTNGNGTNAGGGSDLEPGHVNSFIGYALAPDHLATFHYVLGASTIGRVLKSAGFTTAGDAWIASAVSAWNWAEAIYQGYAATGIAHAAVIEHYITELNLKVNAGWTDAQLTSHIGTIQSTCTNGRVAAGCALLRATDTIAYGNLFDGFPGAFQEISQTNASWDYAATPSAQTYMTSKGQTGYYDGRWATRANNSYLSSMTGGSAYESPRIAGGYMGPNIPVQIIQAAVKDFPVNGENSTFVKWLRANVTFFTGANQANFVPTVGLGFENFKNVLHRDSQAMRNPPPPGITTYTWDYYPIITIRVFNLGSGDSAINFTTSNPSATPNADGLHNEKIVKPYFAALPHQLGLWDNSYMIYSTEFVTQDQILGMLTLCLFLHAYDGNSAVDYTAQTSRPFRARAA